MSWLPCNWSSIDCDSHIWTFTNTTNTSACSLALWSCNNDSSCERVANPDISGQGVLVSFFVTAVLTFICARAILLLHATFHGDDSKTLSVLDRRFIWAVGWWMKTSSMTPVKPDSKIAKWRLVLQKILLTFSDAHLLTGLAIVIAGFSQACLITIYHYHAVVYLTWTSSSVHMVTLTISRFYLRNNKPVLIVLLVFMIALFILLFVAVCLTASSKWPTSVDAGFTFDAQALCTWKDGNLKAWRGDTIFALILLSLGFVCRLCKVFAYTSNDCRHWLRTIPLDGLKRLFNRFRNARAGSTTMVVNVVYTFLSWLVLATYLHVRAFYDIYESLLIEHIWMTLCLLWGFAQIFSWHQLSPLNTFEEKWNFGQILPLLLVVVPLLALPEFYKESRSEAVREAKEVADTEEELKLQMIMPVNPNARSSTLKPMKIRRSFWTETTPTSTIHSKIKTQVPLLDKPNEPYRSVNYNILLFLLFATGLKIFGIIIYPKFLTNQYDVYNGLNTFDTWTDFFCSELTWFSVWLPILCGPGLLWFLVMAPSSRTIRKALRDKAPALLDRHSV